MTSAAPTLILEAARVTGWFFYGIALCCLGMALYADARVGDVALRTAPNWAGVPEWTLSRAESAAFQGTVVLCAKLLAVLAGLQALYSFRRSQFRWGLAAGVAVGASWALVWLWYEAASVVGYDYKVFFGSQLASRFYAVFPNLAAAILAFVIAEFALLPLSRRHRIAPVHPC